MVKASNVYPSKISDGLTSCLTPLETSLRSSRYSSQPLDDQNKYLLEENEF